jgi:hypothetical protein
MSNTLLCKHRVQHTGRECGNCYFVHHAARDLNFAELNAIALFFQVTSAPKKFAASGDFACQRPR